MTKFRSKKKIAGYYWDGKKFGTHLKGGISENKMSNKMERDKWLRNL